MKKMKKMTHKKGISGYPRRFRDGDFKRILRETASDRGKRATIYTPGAVVDNVLLEQGRNGTFLVYDLTEGRFQVGENQWTEWNAGEVVYKPLKRLPWPSMTVPHDYQSIESLFQLTREYIFDRVDFSKPVEYDLASAWVMMTWRMETFNTVPLLFFFGPPSSGKTWAMEVIASLAYRPMMTAISPAVLYRMTEEWHPTLFLDEAQLYMAGDEKSDVLNYLNMSYRRGQTVTRMVEDKIAGQMHPVAFEVFGPKCLAGTSELLQALKTRCFVFTMSKATRSVKMQLGPSDLRSQLLQYRLDTLKRWHQNGREVDVIPTDFLPVQNGRLVELFYPLITVAPPDLHSKLKDHAVALENERVEEEGLSFESIVFNAIRMAHENMIGRLFIPIKEITDQINMSLALSDEPLRSKTISSVAAKLGFTTVRKTNGSNIVFDEVIYQRLLKRYKAIDGDQPKTIEDSI